MFFGVVKEFDNETGFGFLVREDNLAEVFVHISEIERCGIKELKRGQPVKFRAINGRNGFDAAVDIELV